MAEHADTEAASSSLGPVLSSRQFWELMERWGVPDSTALDLIEFPGKLGKSRKRPRFRFTTRQQRITHENDNDAGADTERKEHMGLSRNLQMV